MILVIDNYDSFVYNLVQYLGELGAEPVVYRHDALTLVDAFEQIWQFATQDADPKVFEPMRKPIADRAAAYLEAAAICDEDVAINSAIGDHGLPLIARAWEVRGSGPGRTGSG